MNHTDKSLVAKYRQENPGCELYWCESVPAKFRARAGVQVHHIFSVRDRKDLKSNIIHLSTQAHDWCHRYPVEGRVLCLLTKARKGELDPQELYRCSGMYPAGWLEKSIPKITLEWCEPFIEELRLMLP